MVYNIEISHVSIDIVLSQYVLILHRSGSHLLSNLCLLMSTIIVKTGSKKYF